MIQVCFKQYIDQEIWPLKVLDFYIILRPLTAGMVGSLAMASAKLSCPIATIVALLFGYQTTILSGVLITAACLLLSSFATHVIHLYVLFGILYGVGVNLIFYAGTCVILLHFPAQVSYRTLLAGSGTSFGKLVSLFSRLKV